MTIPPDYFEIRDAADAVVAAADSAGPHGSLGPLAMRPAIEALRKALDSGRERNGIEVVAGDQRWPHVSTTAGCSCGPSRALYCRFPGCPQRARNGHIA